MILRNILLVVCLNLGSSKPVIPKNRCALRGGFQVGEKVEVTWRGPEGNKQAYIGTIVKIADKKEKKILENFEDHCVKIMGKRRGEGYSEDEIIKDLCQATLQNFNSKDLIEDKEELGDSLGKRKRTTTAIMMESLDQANEQDATKKKKRNDNAGKENVNCSQAATPRQESKKGKGKRQQANAEQSPANNIGQLMFSSKYGNKFPSSLTRITQKDVVVSNSPPTPVVDPPVSTPSEMSICNQTNRLVPTSAAAYQAVRQLPANLAAPSSHQVASPQALDPAIIQAKPLALTNTTSQVLSSQSSCQGLRKPVAAVPSSQQATPPDSAPQAVSLVSPKPPLPSTQLAVAPPASGLKATSPSAIDDDLQPQLSPICQISQPSSFLNRTQEGDVQGIAAENAEKLRAENASMKEELATLKKQLEMRPPEYMTAFYLEREKEGQAGNMTLPTEAQVNETFTQQVTYARVKL